MSGPNTILDCYLNKAGDFIIKCNGKEVDVPRRHLCSLSPIFKAKLEQEPSLSFVEFHPKFSSVLKEFRELVYTLRCSVGNEDSTLFDDLLKEMDIKFDVCEPQKWSSPNKTLTNVLQFAAGAGVEETDIIQSLLEQ